MLQHPFTYVCDWNKVPTEDWPSYFDRFAAAGAKHLVFVEKMFEEIFVRPSFRYTLKNWMANSGLTFADAHSQFMADTTLAVADSVRPQVLARQRFELDVMADFGITAGCFHIGKNSETPGMTIAEGRASARKTLEKLLPYAEDLGVVVCIENIFNPLSCVEFLMEMIEAFPTPALGLCYDCGHANLMENGKDKPDSVMYKRWEEGGATPDEIIWEKDVLGTMLPHIVMCHLHDNNGLRDEHKLPGEGNLDILPIMKTLNTSAPRMQAMQSETLPFRNNYSIRELCGRWQELCAQL